jgi:hypothetical protein
VPLKKSIVKPLLACILVEEKKFKTSLQALLPEGPGSNVLDSIAAQLELDQ